MPTVNYLELTNRLRDRFNEPRLNNTTWLTAVGFDQFTKDAINYAYHDVLNAEMEWPFLHAFGVITTDPGIQLYSLIGARFFVESSPYSNPVRYDVGIKYDQGYKYTDSAIPGNINVSQVKEIDWDSFYIYNNINVTTVANEAHTIPSVAPYQVAVINAINWNSSSAVNFASGTELSPTDNLPLVGEYTIGNTSSQKGIYAFNAADAGKAILITYTYAIQNTTFPTPINAEDIRYIDYDLWRQKYLLTDLNATASGYGKPLLVFKPQEFSQAGFSPVPDVIYNIGFECWIDVDDMVAPTDQPVIPERFWQILIDRAQQYCYEFREDPALMAAAEKRYLSGVARMRTELINRKSDMNTGVYWYAKGVSYTSVTPI